MIHLVRHGETEWSRTRRHTSTTEVALTDLGRAQATALAAMLAEVAPAMVLSSPRIRALQTASLAGYGDRVVIDPRLTEWDYGAAEGRTTTEIRRSVPGWSVWTHPLDGGETLDDVARRCDAVLAELPQGDDIDILLFAHAHLLRILAARWCGLPASAGASFMLDPAGWSILGHERTTRCIVRWNLTPPIAR